MAAGGQNIPHIPILEPGFKITCLNCYRRDVTTHIALLNMQQRLNFHGLRLSSAYHLVNVGYAELLLNEYLGDQGLVKMLGLFCTQCGSQLGWLVTDPLSGYGNIGDYYREYLLLVDRLI